MDSVWSSRALWLYSTLFNASSVMFSFNPFVPVFTETIVVIALEILCLLFAIVYTIRMFYLCYQLVVGPQRADPNPLSLPRLTAGMVRALGLGRSFERLLIVDSKEDYADKVVRLLNVDAENHQKS
jgi:hypothetical protein